MTHRIVCFLLLLILVSGCGKKGNMASDPLPEPPEEATQDKGGSNDTTDENLGPVNLDPNIKSLSVGATTYDVMYTDRFFYPEQETGFNPTILVDTFNEDPQFTADETIVLESGQTDVIFSDAKGDWPAIQIEFY
jgi:hypothetical protein